LSPTTKQAMKQPRWYRWTEAKLEPVWSLMLALSAIVISVTILLIVTRKRTMLAAWLTYLFMP
jgi:hypothetical protein